MQIETNDIEILEVVLDMNPDFDAVLGRAIRRHGAHVADLVDLAKFDHPCGRALAIGRLWVRRNAAGSPPPGGPGWSIFDLAPFLDDELARMRIDGSLAGLRPKDVEEFLEGCGCPDCFVCRECRPA